MGEREWVARPGEVMSSRDAARLRRIADQAAGDRVDVVGHACPDCPIGTPAAFCRWCLGTGLVSDSKLTEWQREQNAKLK